MLFQLSEMQFSPIAFMLGKSVTGIALIQLHHDAVARHFGNHAGRSDTKAQPIAAYQGRVKRSGRGKLVVSLML